MEGDVSSAESIAHDILRRVRDAVDVLAPRRLLHSSPPAIEHLDAYDGSDRLSLACTQTSLSASAQRRLVAGWCKTVPSLSSVRFLWLPSRVPQDLFEAICSMPSLESLSIKWSGISSLASLAKARTLKFVHIGSSPSASSLSVFGSLPDLVWLELENIREAADLAFLHSCARLKGLAVHGDSNSLKPLRIKSLQPLASLQRLEWLSLQTVAAQDESLAPLAGLRSLKYLEIANTFKMEEIAAISGALPHVRCELFRPWGDPFIRCGKCRQDTVAKVTGKGKPWLCTVCDRERIRQYEAKFAEIALRHRGGTPGGTPGAT